MSVSWQEKREVVKGQENYMKARLPSKTRSTWPRAGALFATCSLFGALDPSNTSRRVLRGNQKLCTAIRSRSSFSLFPPVILPTPRSSHHFDDRDVLHLVVLS